MAKFMVKRSELKNVCKAVNDRKLAEFKKEIIEILKKQDEKDFKKATDYLNSQEEHFTHLEKSLSGKWIEKAGYGIGTVRVWKGKKYKKIAPDKWVRVFDKEGRGTNIAIGKLIAKVQKIDNVEDLMAFVMANKQRFVDENGVDLPVLDKLRAAVGVKNENLSGESSSYTYGVGENVSREKNKIFEGKEKITKEEADLHKVSRKFEQIPTTELKQRKAKLERWIENKTRSKRDSLNNAIFRESYQKELDTINAVLDKRNEKKETSKIENTTLKYDDNGKIKEVESTLIEPSETARNFKYNKDKLSIDELKDAKNEIDSYIQKLNKEISSLEKIKKENADKLTDNAKANIDGNIAYSKNIINAYTKDKEDCEKLLEEKKNEKPAETKEDENKTYWIQDPYGNRLTNKDAIKRIQDNIARIDDLENSDEPRKDMKIRDLKLDNEYLRDRLNPDDRKESEAEKHQNRSEAMKGNQNAKKYGLTDEQIERYDIQEVVEDINGYGIVKNSEGKYSFIADGRVKDRPDDFEPSIEKVKERINDTYETEKNVQAAKDFNFKDADFGVDVKYQKLPDGKHEYYKKTPDGKALSVKVEISDMREPLNMTYEVTDVKSGKSWQYETAYGNKEKLEWAVERPEQMEKEIKKFFKRDPNKEWDKMNSDTEVSDIDRTFSTNNPDKLKPIAKAEKIEDGKVKLPYSKEVSDEIKHLTNTSKDAVKKGSRYDFLTKLYYDKGNIVSTDGNKLKIVKVGNLDGIENGTFVDIDNTKEGITITADKDFTESHKFPLYERVIPQDNNEKIVLDNKALISKIRELKKDGGITTKDSYVTFDIKGNDLMLDGVKVGDVSAANFEGENSDYINFDADILTSYLSGDKTELFSSKDSSKSMYFGNGSAINVIMPQTKTESHYDSVGNEIKEQRRKDYDSMRSYKVAENEQKARHNAARKERNKDYVDNIVNNYKRSVPADFEEKSIAKLKDWTTEQLQRMYKVANADIDSLMEKKDMGTDAFSAYAYKHFDMSPTNLIGQNYAMKDHPAIVREIERLITERGGKLEKSLFDGFLGLELLEEDIDDIEEEKEEESLWNDYSAEQPELFNSVELQVTEAMNRHFGNCL